ncbi:hypothetical protein HMPREF9946_02492 [Acetobacteraceae bacterium AT-5844]|nr:hypothetical protein HMPREF9946_02492 [Acetobacteraceae bacterium AT-5844]
MNRHFSSTWRPSQAIRGGGGRTWRSVDAGHAAKRRLHDDK